MIRIDKPRVPRAAGIAGWLLLGGLDGVVAHDVMLQKLSFIQVAAEDDRVRVQSQMHSHPETVVVVLKGGRAGLSATGAKIANSLDYTPIRGN